MKKTLIFVVLSIMLTAMAVSQTPDINTIQTVSRNYFDAVTSTQGSQILDIKKEYFNGREVCSFVNFTGGGWVLVASEMSIDPILAYNTVGNYDENEEKPEAFIDLIDGYKQQIDSLKTVGYTNNDMIYKWIEMLQPNYSVNYSPSNGRIGKRLLVDYEREDYLPSWHEDSGMVRWGQDFANNGNCMPISYNYFCHSSSGSRCDCDKRPVGCAAVAMGQIMWHWKWPKQSSYGGYEWLQMPTGIYNDTRVSDGMGIAWLLKNCGDASNTTYQCVGSWTMMTSMARAFVNNFHFPNAERVLRDSFLDSEWSKLLKAEIDAGRPVLYRGDRCDLCSEKHYFVLTDYSDENKFYINWGWWGSKNGYYSLNGLTPGNSKFNKNQRVILGLAPASYQLPSNLTDIPYTDVYFPKEELSRGNILLPASSKKLNINDKYKLVAKNSITLKPGFHAKNGSTFRAIVTSDDPLLIDCGISVTNFNIGFTNGVLKYDVRNANTFQLEVFDSRGAVIFKNAGYFEGNNVIVWDGTNSYNGQLCICNITFRNNCGEKVTNSYKLYSTGKNNFKSDSIYKDLVYTKDIKIMIMPNPNSGKFKVYCDAVSPSMINSIEVYNAVGKSIFTNWTVSDNEINIDNPQKGVYFLRLGYDEGKYVTTKLIIK